MRLENTKPYYAVIFTSILSGDSLDTYETVAQELEVLAAKQEGYLGIESVRSNLKGITISYWENEGAIAAWKSNARHLYAQEKGKRTWYKSFHVRICKVERAYEFAI